MYNFCSTHLGKVKLVKTWFSVMGMLLVSLSILTGCASLVRPNYSQVLTELREGDYVLDPEHAYIHFKVGHLGLSTIVGRFNVVSGTLDFTPESITDLKLQGIIDANSIDLNNTDLESTMQESDWLHTEAYPQITFSSTSVNQLDSGALEIQGEITIRDVTQEIVLLTQFNGGADNILTGKYTLGFSASTAIQRSAFWHRCICSFGWR